MTAAATDHVVLDSYNGRPTLYLTEVEGRPFLHWLLIGYAEPFDVWIHLGITWDDADAITGQPGVWLEPIVDRQVGKTAHVIFSEPGGENVSVSIKIGEGGGVLRRAFGALFSALSDDAAGNTEAKQQLQRLANA